MSLGKKVEQLLEKHGHKTVNNSNDDALRHAEELADLYRNVKPRTDMPSPELYMGFPTAQKKERAVTANSMPQSGEAADRRTTHR